MSRRPKRRNGFFLVLVLIVIVVATLSVYSFTGLMIAYDDSSYLSADMVQARVAAESAAEMIRLMLAEPPESRLEFGGVYNNPQAFQAVPVALGGSGGTINFTVPATALDENGRLAGLRFGLQNESARMNVNALTAIEENWSGVSLVTDALGVADSLGADSDAEDIESQSIAITMLMGLPGMTEEVAASIMDWLDEDDESRLTGGSELQDYENLPTPYTPANGPIRSVEELLLVQGVTPLLLFGADTNRNGVLDLDEQQRYTVTVDTPGALGWAAYFTVYGAENSKTRDGQLRVNVNLDDLELLYEQLAILDNDLYASYIVAYRIAGQPSASASALATTNNEQQNNNNNQGREAGVWTPDALADLDLSGGGGVSLNQVLDLVDSTVTVGNGDNARTYTSPFPGDPIAMNIYLPIIMGMLTAQDADTIPGRVNINECPAELLYGMGILDDEQIEQILELREVDSDDPNRHYETWPAAEGIVTVDQMRQMLPLVTCGGDVFRAQIVSYNEASGVAHRSEFVIDATTVNPKIVSWRDLTHLGRGFDMAVLGVRNTDELEAAIGNSASSSQ